VEESEGAGEIEAAPAAAEEQTQPAEGQPLSPLAPGSPPPGKPGSPIADLLADITGADASSTGGTADRRGSALFTAESKKTAAVTPNRFSLA